MRRRLKITRAMLEEFGYINDCKGCGSAAAGGYHRDHSSDCRRRIEEQLELIEKGKATLNREKERLKATRVDADDQTAPSALPSASREALSSDPSAASSSNPNIEDAIDKSLSNLMKFITENVCNRERLREILKALDKQGIEHTERGEQHNATKSKSDVAKVYSPPRMIHQAAKLGLRPGSSLDLTTHDSDGKPWDFSEKELRMRARNKLEEESPECILVSPMCGAFGQLQGLNYSKMSADEVESKLRAAMTHLLFAMELCKWQAKGGRLFVFEHPAIATSWKRNAVLDLLKLDNIVIVDFDVCSYGMKAAGLDGTRPVKKRTKIMTNSTRIAQRLRKAQCIKSHEHTHLINFKAKQCEVYPEEFCRDVCLGIKE